MALSSVAGNDANPPRSTAASTGITSRLSPPTDACVIGATRTPATPASAAPIVHVADDTSPGEIPSAAAPRSFWETAAVTQPIRVNCHTIDRIAVRPTVMPKSQT